MDSLLVRLLHEVSRRDASDLFLTVGTPPALKIKGRIVQAGQTPLTLAHVEQMMSSVMSPRDLARFADTREANFAFTGPGLPRFRGNAFQQRNSPGMVVRKIQSEALLPTELGLPAQVEDLAMAKRGIVFVVGATGAGKSTTLAGLIHQRNLFGDGHIITVEDPIEFVHQHRNCIITQREVGVDTDSFEVALENTLRQAPDCIVIGEIRTRAAMEQALTFSETGHLVMATLHANNSSQAIERILNFFPRDEQERIRFDLAQNLRAIIGQQLVPTRGNRGLILAPEIMLATEVIRDKVRRNELHLIKDLMARNATHGMVTFDQSLFALYQNGKIAEDTALAHADSLNDLRIRIKLARDSFKDSGHALVKAGLQE